MCPHYDMMMLVSRAGGSFWIWHSSDDVQSHVLSSCGDLWCVPPGVSLGKDMIIIFDSFFQATYYSFFLQLVEYELYFFLLEITELSISYHTMHCLLKGTYKGNLNYNSEVYMQSCVD